jgi:uncharacterized CHY-type Zn-finger protein
MEDDAEDAYNININSHKYQSTQNKQNFQSSEDQTFMIDYTLPKYSKVFERISRIFEGNYLNFIRNVQDPMEKEIHVLMRKYQYMFTRLELNNTIIFDFTKSSDCLVKSLNNFLEEENYLYIEISIVPRFKKNEINFKIPEDCINLKLEIYFSINEEGVVSEISSDSKIHTINLKDSIGDSRNFEILSDLVNESFVIYLKDFQSNIIQGINKFLNYLENYFPELHKKATEKQLLTKDSNEWSQEEQCKLEEALRVHSGEKNAKEKFKKVAEFVKTKTVSQCVSRYKKLVALNKEKKSDFTDQKEEKSESPIRKNEVEVEKNNSQNVKSSTNQSDNSKIKPSLKTDKPKTEVKITVNKKDPNSTSQNLQLQKQKEELIPIPKKVTNTVDLVDDIINQFNAMYGEIKFDTPQTQDENLIRGDTEYTEYSEGNSYEENSEENEEFDEMHMKNESKNKTLNQVNPLNPGQTTSISSKNLDFVMNLFKMGEKHILSLSGVIMNNVALAEITEPNLFFKCGKCRKTGFESHFMKFTKKLNIFYMGASCPKCNNEMHVIFKSELLHQGNLTNAGIIFSVGVIIVDLLPSTYTLNCLNCPDAYKKVKLKIGGLPNNEKQCRSCNQEIVFYIYSGSVNTTLYNDYSFLDNFEVHNFQKFNFSVENEDLSNYVKKFDKMIQVGNPLPDKGVCKHYKLSYRWFRFGCCSKIYPCDICHDDVCDHEAEYARTILCGHCAFEQSSQNKVCAKCGNGFFREDSGKGFWEGGKGCRNKAMMNNKDSHKFKNSKMKTISKKKKEELINKK